MSLLNWEFMESGRYEEMKRKEKRISPREKRINFRGLLGVMLFIAAVATFYLLVDFIGSVIARIPNP